MARELQAVTRAADKAVFALRARDDAIRRADADVQTLLGVGKPAGLSFARIHQIVKNP